MLILEQEVDPRVLRTRQSLHESLARLLETRAFEKLSVQEIAEAAGVNRATFYDHYPDKFALLECMVGVRFGELLQRRGIRFEGDCVSALRGIVEGVCEYVVETPGMIRRSGGHSEPHMQTAVIAVVRWHILDGLRRHPSDGAVSSELLATVVSWAIYGAAQEWVLMPDRSPLAEIVEAVMGLLGTMMQAASRT